MSFYPLLWILPVEQDYIHALMKILSGSVLIYFPYVFLIPGDT